MRRPPPLLRAALLVLVAAAPPGLRAQPIAKANFLGEGSFALPTSGDGALERPRALAWARGDRIHVADERGTVAVFSASGAFQRAYGSGTLKKVAALAIDGAGRSYVLDPDQKRVFVFDSTGTVVQKIGSPGGAAGQLADPLDVAIGPSGLVYVLDKGRKGVQVFSLDGTFIHDVLLPLEAEDPKALAVSPSGSVFVAMKSMPTAVLRLPDLTAALATVDAPSPGARPVELRGATLKDPATLVATPTGTIVTGDRETGVLWSLDGRGGAPVGSDDRLYGGSGSGRGSFKRLEDAALAGADELLMLDGEGRKIERIRLILEARRPADPPMDYPVQFQSFAPTVDPGVIATYARPGGTAWFAIVNAESRGLRVVEARMADHLGVFGGRIRVPEVAAGAATHSFATAVEQAGHAALNDTLLVVTEPRRNRFHVFDLRQDAAVGSFGDNYRDDRRLRDPRGIALFADGRIAVADHGNDRVVVFSADVATLLGSFPLLKAQGVAVTPDGRLFAWDDEGMQAGVLAAGGTTFSALPAGFTAGGVGALTVDAAGNLYALRRESGRVAILDAGMKRLLARVGGQRGIAAGDHLAVDGDGNIYATDVEKGGTVVVRWGVDLPPVRALAASWTPTAADLTWEAVPGSFVTGYQIEGATSEDGPWSRVDASVGTRARAVDPAVLYYRVAPRLLTGAVGRPSAWVPVLHLAAQAVFGKGEWAPARDFARAALAAVEKQAAQADDVTQLTLLWTGFVSAHELQDWADVLAWDERVRAKEWPGEAPTKFATEHGFDHAFRLADTYAHMGNLAAANEWAVTGLQIENAPSDKVAVLARLAFDNAWQLGEWDGVLEVGEFIVEASGSSPDPLVVERLIRAHLRVGSPARARELIALAETAQPSAAAVRRLRTLLFIAGSALGEYADALPIAADVGTAIDSDLFVPFQGALARARLETGDRPGARTALKALLADPRDAAALSDPIAARSALALFGSYIEAGEAPSAHGLLDSLVAALPANLSDVRAEVLRQADSVAAVADTRAKLGEGLSAYRDARFREAVRFFQTADKRTDLDVDQRLMVKELLAGSLYSFARTEEADEVYRGVYLVDPAFDLTAHLGRVLEVYGVAVFTEEMVTHFAELGPLR